jgi:hypothetical protein
MARRAGVNAKLLKMIEARRHRAAENGFTPFFSQARAALSSLSRPDPAILSNDS